MKINRFKIIKMSSNLCGETSRLKFYTITITIRQTTKFGNQDLLVHQYERYQKIFTT